MRLPPPHWMDWGTAREARALAWVGFSEDIRRGRICLVGCEFNPGMASLVIKQNMKAASVSMPVYTWLSPTAGGCAWEAPRGHWEWNLVVSQMVSPGGGSLWLFTRQQRCDLGKSPNFSGLTLHLPEEKALQ